MDHQENKGNYQPDDWKGIEHALENGFQDQFSVLRSRFSVALLALHIAA
jgi:hypothetical protein